MNVTLYLPPGKFLTKKQKQELQKLAEDPDVDLLCAWGEAQAAAGDIPENETSTWVADTEVLDVNEKIMAKIQELDIPAAVQIDACDDSEACEWNLRSELFWYNPKTKKSHQKPCGCNDPAPHFESKEVMDILRNPSALESWMESLEPLRILEIEPPFMAPTEKEVEAYIAHKVEIRMEDAESCTSHKKEYASIYRSGIPSPLSLSSEEIQEIITQNDEEPEVA